jgi:DNA-binding transcriptional regulator YiaG
MQAAVADNSVTRTLALALRTMGSRTRLAEHLGATEELLQEWLDGRREPPTSIYLLALDLVASGSLGTGIRAVRAPRRKSPGGRPR